MPHPDLPDTSPVDPGTHPDGVCYDVVLSSSTYAASPRDALGVFLAQLSTGHVFVQVSSDEADVHHELDDLGGIAPGELIETLACLLSTATDTAALGGHERLRLLSAIDALRARLVDNP